MVDGFAVRMIAGNHPGFEDLDSALDTPSEGESLVAAMFG